MNGRIYDARLGRFLQADPVVQSPFYTQSYNRYSYGFNNPLNGTDPSGYIFGIDDLIVGALIGAAFGAAGKALDIPILSAIGGIISCASGSPACAAGFAFGSTIGAGGSFADAFKNGLLAGASAWAFSEIGNTSFGAHDAVIRPIAHGVVGGIANVLQGGKFGHGFVSAGLTKAIGVNDLIGTDADLRNVRIAVAAVVGGTISEITGGKFANGAITAAFGQAYNGETQAAAEERYKQLHAQNFAFQDKLLAFFASNPDGVYSLSEEELQLVVDLEVLEAGRTQRVGRKLDYL